MIKTTRQVICDVCQSDITAINSYAPCIYGSQSLAAYLEFDHVCPTCARALKSAVETQVEHQRRAALLAAAAKG